MKVGAAGTAEADARQRDAASGTTFASAMPEASARSTYVRFVEALGTVGASVSEHGDR